MKTQRRILERAKRGDPEAIACFITHCLHREGVVAKASLEGDCLQILLESSQVPDQQKVVELIQYNLEHLEVSLPETIQVCSKQMGEDRPIWSFSLSQSELMLQDQGDFTPRADCLKTFSPQSSTQKLSIGSGTQSNIADEHTIQQIKQHSARSPRFMSTSITAIAALIAINLFWGFRSMFRLQAESQAYADKAVSQIVTVWNAEALLDRASPEFFKVMSQAQVQQLFNQLSQDLGVLKQYQQALCNISTNLIQNDMTISRCRTRLIFEKAPAILELELIWQDQQWKIYRFEVISSDPVYG
jgi:hypothetical protein